MPNMIQFPFPINLLKISIQSSVALAGFLALTSAHAETISDLRIEGAPGWQVTDDPHPLLSWFPLGETKGVAVTGYEVIAAKSAADAEKGDGSWWKSEFLPLENGSRCQLNATDFPSRSEIWWRVRPVLQNGKFGSWSDTANFETGLKSPSDWKGEWIAMAPAERKRSAPQFRKSFHIDKPVSKARLYVCGLGWHESWLNGEKLGNEVLQPAQTDYDQRNFYVSHDVTAQVHEGENVLGVWVGDGFFNQDRVWGPNGMSYGQPRVKAQLEVTHSDGSVTIVPTDLTWQCKASPITASNVYAGEDYDARLTDPAWADTGFIKEGWKPVVKTGQPGGKLIAQNLPPCRRLGIEKVRSVRELKPGTWVYDFGVNLVGWAKFSVDATPGTRITVRFAEDLLADGSLNFETGGVVNTKVIQTDNYICRGDGPETWEPRFTYHGFRYAELTITDGTLKSGTPDKDLLEGIIVHNDLPVTGSFESSDETLNRAFEWANRTFVGNIQGVPTDCPIRERCGWTGDAHLIVPYSMYRFDAASLWNKYTGDIVSTASRDSNMLVFGRGMGERTVKPKAAGIPTMVAPGKRFIGEASPDWGSAIVFIPWDVYLYSGDLRPLERNYDSMHQWVLHLEGRATDDILYSGLGDWCKPQPDAKSMAEPREYYGQVIPMLSTACYYRSAKIMADTAELLGKNEDAIRFTKLAEDIRKAFTREFYGPDASMVPDQTINAIAVNWEVLPPERRAEAAAKLAEQVKGAGNHFLTGVFGMPALWPTLLEYGHQETAWKALQNDSSPSLNYLAKRGATTFWEVWPVEGNADDVYSRSMSHPFQAGFVHWFFSGLAGIRPDPVNPGFKTILLEPQLIDGLDWVKCSFDSPMGKIQSSWKREANTLTWNITIPPGATSQVRVPGRMTQLTPSDKTQLPRDADDAQGQAQRLTLSAGTYTLISTL